MDSMSFVLFGATGDLAKRKIYPALYNLYRENKLGSSLSVVGLGRRELTNEVFQENVRNSLKEFSRNKPEENADYERFIQSFQYCALDVTNKEDYKKLLELVQKREQELDLLENRMFYLAVAPEFFDIIALNVKESGLGDTKGWKRLVIEKPFGHDLKSAQILNEKLSKAFKEEEVYRIDHYLGKGMVRNLDTLRSSNFIFESIWNNKCISNVQITASEVVGVEERAGYYDHTGALKDMIQNHLLQMLMMVAMDIPKNPTNDEVHKEKAKVLNSVRFLNKEEVKEHVVRAQYIEGQINGKSAIGYRQEPGVGENSVTETYVAARVLIENERWSGVPFYLRTGKRMDKKSTKIAIEFKQVSNNEGASPNAIIIEINPTEGVHFRLNGKNLVNDSKMDLLNLNFTETNSDVPEAYERMIFDALKGDSTYFAHWDEVELSWKWVQPVLEAFEGDFTVCEYPSGSKGPKEADNLLSTDGFKWI